MGKEVNINLGDKSSKEKGRSCFDGVCPPNPLHLLEEASGALPMILGLGLTFLKMDQFNRPLANTAMQMIEGLAPQIEKNAMKFGAVINSLTEASHNVSAKMSKHPDDFTKEDKVHLVQMLINDENNYFDSYDSALDFLSYQNPGFVKALYKTLMANMPKGDKQIVHANSREGKNNIEKNSDPDRKPVSTDRYTDLHDNLLDDHIAKAKQGLALSTVGLQGKGLFNSPAAAEAIQKYTDINTDKPNEELSKNVARLNQKAEKDKEIAKISFKQSVEDDEEGAIDTLDKDKMTPQEVSRLNKLKSKSKLNKKEIKEKKKLEDRKKEIDEKHKNLADKVPDEEPITSARKEITDNSAKSKATLASEKATRAEAKVKAAKENVKVAQAKVDDANEKVNTAESVKNTAQNALDKKSNMDPTLREKLETNLQETVKAEGNAKEQVQKLTSALKEAEAAAEAAKAEAAKAKTKAEEAEAAKAKTKAEEAAAEAEKAAE